MQEVYREPVLCRVGSRAGSGIGGENLNLVCCMGQPPGKKESGVKSGLQYQTPINPLLVKGCDPKAP